MLDKLGQPYNHTQVLNKNGSIPEGCPSLSGFNVAVAAIAMFSTWNDGGNLWGFSGRAIAF